MKHRYLNRWRRVAVALWGVCCLLPGVLVALSRSPSAEVRVEKLSQLYGHEVGAYVGYCPSALLATVQARDHPVLLKPPRAKFSQTT